jgi:hypothetical protein
VLENFFADNGNDPIAIVSLLSMFAALGVATLVIGFYMGKHEYWKYLWKAIGIGTAGIMICYVFLVIFLNPRDQDSDLLAAIGLIVGTLPVMYAVGQILFIGMVVGSIRAKKTNFELVS